MDSFNKKKEKIKHNKISYNLLSSYNDKLISKIIGKNKINQKNENDNIINTYNPEKESISLTDEDTSKNINTKEKGNIKRTKQKKDIINYEEFEERMHSLSLRQRTILMNQKKIFCDKVKEEAMQNAKLKLDI